MVFGKDDDESAKDTKIAVSVFLNKEYIEEQFKDNPKSTEDIKSIVWEEIKKINQHLVFEKRIKEVVIRDEEFEKTTTMKIKGHLVKSS